MNDIIVHLAGPSVTVSGRIIQRCMVCGEKLCDSLNAAMPLKPDGSVPTFPVFAIDALVEVEEGNPKRYSVIQDIDHKIPEHFCISLVE